MYCKNCGRQIDDDASFCSYCGTKVRQGREAAPASAQQRKATHRCSICGGANIDIQVLQENRGSRTVTNTNSQYRQKGHGCLWWLIFGWWRWIVDLSLWVFFFPFRLIAQLLKRKKYVGTSQSVSRTNNKVEYRTVYLCKDCGAHWEA